MRESLPLTYPIISHLREVCIKHGVPFATAILISEEVDAILQSRDHVSSLNGTGFTRTFVPKHCK